MGSSTYYALMRAAGTVLTGFCLVLLAATLVTTGPERDTSLQLLGGLVLLLPAGAATTILLRRWLRRALDPAHLLTVTLVNAAVFGMAAALLVSSGRDTSAVALLALTTGAVAVLTARRVRLASLPVLVLGGSLGFLAFTFAGSGAIIAVGAVVTLLAAAAVSVSTALDGSPAPPEPAAPRELVDARPN